MLRIFGKQNKPSQNLNAIERDFKGYGERKIPYKSQEYWTIMDRKCFYSGKGFRSHPSLFDVMLKDNKLFYIGLNHGMIGIS